MSSSTFKPIDSLIQHLRGGDPYGKIEAVKLYEALKRISDALSQTVMDIDSDTNISISSESLTIGERSKLNFVEGANINLTVTEDINQERIDVNVATNINIVIDQVSPNNVSVGYDNMSTLGSGFNSVVVGQSCYKGNTTGFANVCIGSSVLATANTTGYQNVGIGYVTLAANTTGHDNVAIGADALLVNTEGDNNIAIGFQALKSNVTGDDCTAVGTKALDVSTASQNTAFGSSALGATTSGSGNVGVGPSAGIANTTGSDNTCIGNAATLGANNLTNATALGNTASVDASNKVRIGNSSVTVIEGQVDWTFISDKEQKENFKVLDPESILVKLGQVPVTSWNYIGHNPIEFRHIGPMAQDIHAMFGTEEGRKIGTDKTISSGDLTGLLILSVQALLNRTDLLQKQLDKLKV